uniref:Pre-mRNA-splicing factor SLU7 n=1 Tax=Glossina morsitans morsitans TaxID=37546 RepID=A0A1B0GBZ5_GLOMM
MFIIHSKETVGGEEPNKKSREECRMPKGLEEARKASTAPAAVDGEGRDINPYILQYIANARWYYAAQDTSRLVTKFRKGACKNCGAMTHNHKDCLETPREVLAKYANSLVVHEYVKVEEAKRQLKAEKLTDSGAEISDDDSNEDKYDDEVDTPGTKVDSEQRITVRNLRIREDTAKYRRNSDPNSTYYDPVTRSMRDNPYPQVLAEESEFDGENFVRFTGDTTKHAAARLFAWMKHSVNRLWQDLSKCVERRLDNLKTIAGKEDSLENRLLAWEEALARLH